MTSYRGGAVVLASCLALVLSLGLALAATAGEGKHGARHAGECEESTFPATGQTTPHTAITAGGSGTAVSDDGTVRAGGRLRYRDNGDGTITDRNTRLMWEKKSLDGGLHDVRSRFDWSLAFSDRAIWDWLAEVNAEVNAEGGTGFAGHHDWRIPNVRELQSLVDYGRFNPAVDPVFNSGAFAGCTVLACSNTMADFYWSSTTHAQFDAAAWFVDFDSGAVFAIGKGFGIFVRAVRGGCVPTRDEDD